MGFFNDLVQLIKTHFAPPAPGEPSPPPPQPLPSPEQKGPTGVPLSPFARPFVRPEDGITVQTAAAAQYADENAKKSSPEEYVKRNPDRIFKMRPDDPVDHGRTVHDRSKDPTQR